MAIYHCGVKMISRGKGRSAVAAAAYRAGEKITNAYDGLTHDYRRRAHVAHSEIIAPANAPIWARSRGELWNHVELSEKRSNSQTAREVEVALPTELDLAKQVDLCRAYCGIFVADGMVADFSIHANDGNPHCHILLTTREIDSTGLTKKNRAWNSKEYLAKIRDSWEDVANKALEAAGLDERVSAKSNKDLGLEALPTIHEGYAARKMERQGKKSDRCELNREIKELNAEMAEFEQVELPKQREKYRALLRKKRQLEAKQKAEEERKAKEQEKKQKANPMARFFAYAVPQPTTETVLLNLPHRKDLYLCDYEKLMAYYEHPVPIEDVERYGMMPIDETFTDKGYPAPSILLAERKARREEEERRLRPYPWVKTTEPDVPFIEPPLDIDEQGILAVREWIERTWDALGKTFTAAIDEDALAAAMEQRIHDDPGLRREYVAPMLGLANEIRKAEAEHEANARAADERIRKAEQGVADAEAEHQSAQAKWQQLAKKTGVNKWRSGWGVLLDSKKIWDYAMADGDAVKEAAKAAKSRLDAAQKDLGDARRAKADIEEGDTAKKKTLLERHRMAQERMESKIGALVWAAAENAVHALHRLKKSLSTLQAALGRAEARQRERDESQIAGAIRDWAREPGADFQRALHAAMDRVDAESPLADGKGGYARKLADAVLKRDDIRRIRAEAYARREAERQDAPRRGWSR